MTRKPYWYIERYYWWFW